ncbi:MAG TPA: aldehyde dehydrogenase family protein [Pseudolysinimonas sp.]|nr:aldehyde dehydrogenase family protein [Pseudolysinimonas sp.]
MSTAPAPIPVRNPRTGLVDLTLQPPSAEELDEICARLRAGQLAWEKAGIEHRAEVMLRWADEMDKRSDEIIEAERVDTGRFRIPREMVGATIWSIREWAKRAPGIVASEARLGQSSARSTVDFASQLRPYQLVGAISPWNQPIVLSTIDAIPALLAGCAVIVKCSEFAPRFARPLMDAVRAVPELAEVFLFIDGGAETGQALIERVDALCFTGSVPTGRKVAAACAERFIPAFLELGGKDPVIVTATADEDRAVTAVLRGGVYATGQVCHAIERVYVQRTKYDSFVEKLVHDAEQLQLSYPDDAQGHVGPFIMARQAEIADAQLDDAVAKGARILTGGKSEVHGGGVYMRPTVIVDVTHDMDIMTQETFAPIIPVMAYDTDEEAVRLANDSEFGLSGAVIAGTLDEARVLGEQIDAGGITLQDTTLTSAIMLDSEKTSFKASGLGDSRMGPSAIMRYYRRKVLITNTTVPVDMADLVEDLPVSAIIR